MNEILSSDYKQFLKDVKNAIQVAQIKAMVTANQQLLQLYWDIGKMILERQEKSKWGDKVLEQLSKDLKEDYPNMKGFSLRNLKYMRVFARENPDFQIGQEPLAQITWYHNITLLEKVKNSQARLWYAQKALEFGWSRDVLVIHIERKLFDREGKAITNFDIALPKPESDLANQTLKDPYIFDFVSLTKDYVEKELEDALVKHIVHFLLELGKGFAFVGRQYQIFVDDDEYKIDLLFYNLELRRYVVIDLKTRKFKPEDVGKMNFYVNAVDDLLKKEYDNETIGLILCKDKNNVKAEYALRNVSTPIGISEYRILESLPDEIKSTLPSIEELEQKLRDVNDLEDDSKQK